MALARPHFLMAGISGGFPAGLTVVLSVLRPDLVGAMMGHLAGYVAMSVMALASGLGSGSMLLGWWLVDRFVGKERHTVRRVLNVAIGGLSLALFTLPAVFLVLFSPIAFAMLIGGPVQL
jgi:hypothetical protein